VAYTLGVIVIVLAGLGIAFGESGSGVRKILMVVVGLAIAFMAASIVATLYNTSSGLAF
jgi:type IV secretion system protein TrbC